MHNFFTQPRSGGAMLGSHAEAWGPSSPLIYMESEMRIYGRHHRLASSTLFLLHATYPTLRRGVSHSHAATRLITISFILTVAKSSL